MGVSCASADTAGKLRGKIHQVEMKFNNFTFPAAVQRLQSARNNSPTILLFIPAASDTKADAMDDKPPGIINKPRARNGGQHD
jgi:hypothetical protein